MTITAKRAWINQPSTLQPLHHLHGTNVLAIPEDASTSRIYFLEGDTISQQASNLWLSEGWLPKEKEANDQSEVLEVVQGIHAALSRMIDAHDPDSIEAEWLSHSHELVSKLKGEGAATEQPRSLPTPKA